LASNNPVTRFQKSQLYALTFLHITIDMFPGAIAPIIPAIRERFSLSLTAGVSLITICYISCNIFQMLLGHLRPYKKTPLMMVIGVAFAPAICLIAFVPVIENAFWLLAAAMALCGFGVSVSHPESLRALHRLKRLPSAMGTAVFLNGGYLGFSAGALVAAFLVQHLGLPGLLIMAVPAAICIALIYLMHIKLDAEKQNGKLSEVEDVHSFWLLFVMGCPIAISATLLPALLPTALAEMGFKLSYGGMPAMMLGIGAIAGSLFWANMAKRFGQFRCLVVAAALAAIPAAIYMALLKFPSAVILLLPTGFCGGAAYTLIVSLARYSRGLVLGQRMGIMVGGVWGVASLLLIATGPMADKFGTVAVLNFAWTGYAATAIIGVANGIYKKLKT
jgi:FSR family fosmidomycin resistance protein-like MFS transporter